jgi:hypothetical protein
VSIKFCQVPRKKRHIVATHQSAVWSDLDLENDMQSYEPSSTDHVIKKLQVMRPRTSTSVTPVTTRVTKDESLKKRADNDARKHYV